MLNYIGPNDGEGIRVYINGTQEDSDTAKNNNPKSAGDGRVVVGRWNTDRDDHNSSVQIDELIFFNRYLSPAEIAALATAT